MPSGNRWLYGPWIDLLFGAGGLYLAVFAAFTVAGSQLIASWPAALTPILLMLLSMPHYGGTLLRVYEQRNDRRAYVLFSVWATVGVIAMLAVSAHNANVGALFFTLYLTWSPWHYTGQNYGIALLFLGRRDIQIGPATKRLIYTSFVTSFALAFVVAHSDRPGMHLNPLDYLGSGIAFVSLGIPLAWADALVVLGLVTVTATTLAWVVLLSRQAPLRDLVPTLMLLLTQSLWFTVPLAVRQFEWNTGVGPLDGYLIIRKYYFLIAIGHALQYLWITSYYARSAGSAGQLRYGAKVLVSGVAVWTVPFIVFSPDALGSISVGEGLASLVAAAVNIHHFILDGAIWKLRSSRVANVLIRRAPETGRAAPVEPKTWEWPRLAVWGAATAAVGIALLSLWDEQMSLRRALASGDARAADRVLDRERWFGKDKGNHRISVGKLAALDGDWELALEQFQRAAKLGDRSAWAKLGEARALEMLGRHDAANLAYRVGLAEIGPVTRMVRDLMETGRGDWALSLLERAIEEHPDSAKLRGWRAAFLYQAGESAAALEDLQRAAALAPEDRSLANNLAWMLATTPDPSLRNPAEAIRLAEAALEREGGRDFGLHDTLSAAYAAAGRFEDAVRTAEAGLRLDADPRRRAQLEQRLDLYRAERSYVETPPSS